MYYLTSAPRDRGYDLYYQAKDLSEKTMSALDDGDTEQSLQFEQQAIIACEKSLRAFNRGYPILVSEGIPSNTRKLNVQTYQNDLAMAHLVKLHLIANSGKWAALGDVQENVGLKELLNKCESLFTLVRNHNAKNIAYYPEAKGDNFKKLIKQNVLNNLYARMNFSQNFALNSKASLENIETIAELDNKLHMEERAILGSRLEFTTEEKSKLQSDINYTFGKLNERQADLLQEQAENAELSQPEKIAYLQRAIIKYKKSRADYLSYDSDYNIDAIDLSLLTVLENLYLLSREQKYLRKMHFYAGIKDLLSRFEKQEQVNNYFELLDHLITASQHQNQEKSCYDYACLIVQKSQHIDIETQNIYIKELIDKSLKLKSEYESKTLAEAHQHIKSRKRQRVEAQATSMPVAAASPSSSPLPAHSPQKEDEFEFELTTKTTFSISESAASSTEQVPSKKISGSPLRIKTKTTLTASPPRNGRQQTNSTNRTSIVSMIYSLNSPSEKDTPMQSASAAPGLRPASAEYASIQIERPSRRRLTVTFNQAREQSAQVFSRHSSITETFGALSPLHHHHSQISPRSALRAHSEFKEQLETSSRFFAPPRLRRQVSGVNSVSQRLIELALAPLEHRTCEKNLAADIFVAFANGLNRLRSLEAHNKIVYAMTQHALLSTALKIAPLSFSTKAKYQDFLQNDSWAKKERTHKHFKTPKEDPYAKAYRFAAINSHPTLLRAIETVLTDFLLELEAIKITPADLKQLSKNIVTELAHGERRRTHPFYQSNLEANLRALENTSASPTSPLSPSV